MIKQANVIKATKIMLCSAISGLVTSFAAASVHPGLIQYPTLSPNAESIVFSAAGDLWSIPTRGGNANRLTAHPAIEGRAKFNPQGTQIAFESNRGGVANIFLADVHGAGNSISLTGIQRVTTSDRTQWLGGFSVDGASVLYSSYVFPEIYRQPRMYQVPIDGGPMQDLTGAFGRAPVPAGVDGETDESVYFVRGYYYPNRVLYRGPGNLDIWKYNVKSSEFTQITGFDGNDMDPCPLPDGSLIYLSSKGGKYNLFQLDAGKADPNGRRPGRQLTDFSSGQGDGTLMAGARDLSVSQDGTLAVFVVANTLYTLDLTVKKAVPVAVDFVMGTDSVRDQIKRVNISTKVTQGTIHPSGDAVVVVARNELFVRSTEDEYPSRRITNSPARERDVVWSADGEILYFVADDEQSLGSIFSAKVLLSNEDIKPKDIEEDPETESSDKSEDQADEDSIEDESASTIEDESGDDQVSEDGDESESASESESEEKEESVDHGARWAGSLRFEVSPVVAGDKLTYAPLPSPDGKKLLYKQDRGDLILLDLESGDTRILLESWADPTAIWASDSVHIVYADTDLNFNMDIFLLDTRLNEDGTSHDPVNLTKHPDLDHSPQLSADGKILTFLSDRGSNNWQWDVYSIHLDYTLDGMPRYELDAYYKNAVKKAKESKPLDVNDPPEIEPLKFDVADSYMRVRRLTNTPDPETNLAMAPGGNRIAFSVDGSFVSIDQFGKERKTIQDGSVSNPRISLDGSSIGFVHGGQYKGAGITGGSAKTYSIDATIEIDRQAELSQKFDEATGRFGMSFYHPTLKGLNWETISAQYKALAMQTRTNAGFLRVVNYLFGEIDGSHTGIWGGDGFGASSTKTGYLGIDTTAVKDGYRVDRIYWRGAADRMDDGLMVGDVIIALGDQRLVDAQTKAGLLDLHNSLAGMSGNEVLVEYLRENTETGDWDNLFGLVTPQSFGSGSVIRYAQEVRDRQAEVAEMSNGRLGYLHIRSMGAASVRDFERDLFAAADGKDGLVIDVRDNGGGWTTDVLLASLTAPNHAYTIPRGADPSKVQPDSYPRDRRLIYAYSRPIVVLINENSFSNAEIFAHAIRTTKRGRLIGVQTFGGVISTGSFSLIDGTSVRRPFRGWYLPDGTDMENNGAKPHVMVKQTPTDEAAGLDPQLKAAVKDLLKTIK